MMNRRPILILALLALTAFLFASKKKPTPPILRPVGFSLLQLAAPVDYNWRGSSDQTLSGIVWYPADTSPGEEKDQFIGPPDVPLFYAGRAAKDATLAPAFGKFPLIALSHGTGGSAMQMAWLGTYLAARGYIVVAVNHPGNNAVTGYTFLFARHSGGIRWARPQTDSKLSQDGWTAAKSPTQVCPRSAVRGGHRHGLPGIPGE
jgi:platelet-activating factor acetylhydrolase isoform II